MTTLIRYIHLNPVKADIVDLPQEYRWSSHNAYLGDKETSWLSPEIGLEYFNYDKKIYEEYVMQGVGQHENFDIDTGRLCIELDRLVEVVCNYYELKPDTLNSTSRSGQGGHARSMIALLAKDLHRIGIEEIADRFSRNREAVRKAKNRLQAKLHSSPQIRAEVDEIYQALFEC